MGPPEGREAPEAVMGPRRPGWTLVATTSGPRGWHLIKTIGEFSTVVTLCKVTGRSISESEREIIFCPACSEAAPTCDVTKPPPCWAGASFPSKAGPSATRGAHPSRSRKEVAMSDHNEVPYIGPIYPLSFENFERLDDEQRERFWAAASFVADSNDALSDLLDP